MQHLLIYFQLSIFKNKSKLIKTMYEKKMFNKVAFQYIHRKSTKNFLELDKYNVFKAPNFSSSCKPSLPTSVQNINVFWCSMLFLSLHIVFDIKRYRMSYTKI